MSDNGTEHSAEKAKKLAEHRYKELKEYFSHRWENIHTEEELREKVISSTKLYNTSIHDMGGGYTVCDFDYAETSGTISIDDESKFELADVIDVWMPDLETPFSFEMK